MSGPTPGADLVDGLGPIDADLSNPDHFTSGVPHATFRHLRDRAIELGFEYRLMPVEIDTPITDRGGSGGRVQ